MSNVPSELQYLTSHEWIRNEGDGTVTMGITDHAQDLLGDVVYVELPEVGAVLASGDDMGVVESVKAASDIYAPVSGKVIAVNGELEEAPEMINSDPYGDGWFIKIELSDTSELTDLLSSDEYVSHCDEDN